MNTFKIFLNTIYSGIFWAWNVIFIITVYLGILPYIGVPLVLATFDGAIAIDFFLTLSILIALPLAFTLIGLTYFRGKPKQLIRLFYGVEAPLFTWCLIRLFIVRELTLASGLFLLTFLGCVFVFALDVFSDQDNRLTINPWLKIVSHSLLLMMGIYLGLILLFYAFPVAVNIIIWLGNFIIAFFSFVWVGEFIEFLADGSYWLSALMILGFSLVLFGFTASLFVGLPFALTTLYSRLGWQTLQEFTRNYGKKITFGVATGVITLWLVLFTGFNQQPQVQAFELLDQNSNNRQTLLASTKTIRQGLVNANLSAYRYISTVEDNNHVFAMYTNIGFNQSLSLFLQHSYNRLLAPFLYQGSKADIKKSASLYAELFDTPLQKAERKSVRHAIKSTSIIDEAKAGLLNIDQHKVWLEKQEVTVKPQGDWADIEIHEVYNNQTPDVEEIFYYFSLPESAAITGLWLGESDDLNQRFAFQVSPRGAAQEVYNSQVRRARPIDPALLEQVGIGQYRLRAFPVPPRLSSDEIRNLQKQRKMHLWLTYQVMKQKDGWALPQLAEKRNIFWTRYTQRIRNGKRKWLFDDVWFEDFQADSNNQGKKSHQVNLDNGYQVAVNPLAKEDYALPQQQKYALILDTSYSMGNHRQELAQSLAWWENNLQGNEVDLYVTDVEGNQARKLNNLQALNLSEQIFYGFLSTADMLEQYQKLSNGESYDAVLLLTDEGSYELSEDKQSIGEMKSPLWLIHLGGQFPRAYNDAVLEAIQNSHGGIADNLSTVIQRLATQTAKNSLVVDGYSWTVGQTQATQVANNDALEAMSARQLVTYLSQQSTDKLSVEELDNIHQVAKNYGVVTPYSSMIVLVNDQQREQLRQAEAKDDRFEREVEKGFEDLNTPFSPMEVSGVPEPNFIVLLSVMCLALCLVWYKQSKGDTVQEDHQ